MATYSQSAMFVGFFVDTNGAPLSGGTLSAFLAGTTTPTNMYVDSSGTIGGSVITLNARGEPEISGNTVMIWLDTALTYKFQLKDSTGTSIWTIDNQVPSSFLASTNIDDMDPAAQLDGTELVPISQGGDGVAATTQQILGKPVTRFMGHSRNRYQDFSHLHRTSTTFDSGNTAGTLFGAEPFLCWASGTDAKVTQGSVTYYRVGIAACNLGSQITGYSACVSSFYPFAFNPEGTESARVDIMASLSNVPSGAQNYIVQVGLFSAPTALATHGVFFRGTLTDTDWRTIVKNSAGQDTSTTGALLTASEYSISSVAPTFGVEHDPVANKFNFYINGALVAEEDDTYTPTIFEPMYMGVAIFRTNGTVNRLVLMDALQYSIPDSFASGTYF